MSDPLLDVSVAARRLYISNSTLYRLLRGGYIPFVKLGTKRGYKIRQSEIDNFLRRREQNAGYD